MEAIWVVISLFGLYRYFRPQPLRL